MSDGGKGSARRPGSGYDDGYDRIFNKRNSRDDDQKAKQTVPAEADPAGRGDHSGADADSGGRMRSR